VISERGNDLSPSVLIRQVFGITVDKKKLAWIEVESGHDPIRQLKRWVRMPSKVGPERLNRATHAMAAKQP